MLLVWDLGTAEVVPKAGLPDLLEPLLRLSTLTSRAVCLKPSACCLLSMSRTASWKEDVVLLTRPSRFLAATCSESISPLMLSAVAANACATATRICDTSLHAMRISV